jgi:hypothetical protein
MHNLSALLKSDGCSFSPLSGIELVGEKVQQVVTMGGNFIDGSGHDRTNWGGSNALCEYTSWSCLNKERNAMCRFVIENCPAPFVASGWEVGCGDYHNAKRGNVMTGQRLKELDPNHIVRRSYEYHFASRGGDQKIDRHSNDQCALLFAIRGEGANFEAFVDGEIQLSDTGDCRWSQKPNRSQGYIRKKRAKEKIADEIEQLMMGSRPPIVESKPNAPTDLLVRVADNRTALSWKAADDSDNGSWIVGYRIYCDEEMIGTARGTQFTAKLGQRGEKWEVRSLNASGTVSAGTIAARSD